MNNFDFMGAALNLAAERRGFCAPNPSVGAVIVKAGTVIGQGAHWACGQPHAEVMALQSLGQTAAGATLYVTLEPCSHHGRTPPCTDLIIRSGIREVFFGMHDPNPQVSGQGAAVLQQAGVACQWLPSVEVDYFYQSYRYWLARQLPWVTIKLAVSLDGKIAGFSSKPVALTGAACHEFTHQYRLHSDAILTTAATIIADDPRLNARFDTEVVAKPLYILDSQLRLPFNAQVFHTAKSLTVFHSTAAPTHQRALLEAMNVRCVAIKTADHGLDLTTVLATIGADGCHDLWVETGGHCFQSFLAQNLAQRVFIYVAPVILGSDATPAVTQPLHWFPNAAQIIWDHLGQDGLMRVDLMQA